MITQIGHVAVPVDNAEAAAKWYVETLGLVRGSTGESRSGHHWVRLHTAMAETPELLLVSRHSDYRGAQKEELRNDPLRGHVTLFVADCVSECRRLAAAGVSVSSPEVAAWGVQASVTDPDGNEFILLQPAVGT